MTYSQELNTNLLKLSLFVYIAGTFKGIESVIIAGDTFVAKTAKIHFLRLKNCFTTQHFETTIKASDRYNTSNAFINARICNAMVSGFEHAQNMPKLVVLVLENDVINAVEKGKYAPIFYNRMIADVIKEFHKIVEKFRKLLPVYAQRQNWPKLVFIMPTLHRFFNDYDDRRTFIDSLEKMVKDHDDVMALKLLQVWNENNPNFFYQQQQRYSGEGLNALWSAIDKTIAYCSRKITRDDLKYDKLNQLGFPDVNSDDDRSANKHPSGSSTRHNDRTERNQEPKRFWRLHQDRQEDRRDRYRLPRPNFYN